MKNAITYGLEGDGTLTSVRDYAAQHKIDISKPAEKQQFDKEKIDAFILKRRKGQKKKVGRKRGANPWNPNNYKYGYIKICRG